MALVDVTGGDRSRMLSESPTRRASASFLRTKEFRMSSNVSASVPIPGGRVEVADSAVITIVHETVIGSYGIVDLAPRSFGSSLVRKLGLGSGPHGIAVSVDGSRVSIDVSVVVEYGTPIFTVASNVMQAVKFNVERLLGLHVERVNVNVDGLHVSQSARSIM
jgi:uncharacterized alkaline shock family protein YloU